MIRQTESRPAVPINADNTSAKSLSATKKTIRCTALAALLLPYVLSAVTVDVTFDAALTNATEWVYSDKIMISSDNDGHPYFKTLQSYISSPEYPFNITSATVRISCSNTSPTRWLCVTTSAGEKSRAAAVGKADTQESQTFLFDANDSVRTLKFSLEGNGSTGNWHLYSATISGVPLTAAPTGLQANNIKGTHFTLSWENPETAVSNRIEVLKVLESEGAPA